MSVPRATMRLQFQRGFTFDDATPLAAYFADLGVSHLYASPIATARSGSMHGYDVVDPGTINPELGGEDAFRRLAASLRAAGLGLIIDIVPNHMAVGGADNAWWLDVLQNGRNSAFAHYFDIDWEADDPMLHGKVLAPVLGRSYAEVLTSGELKLRFDAARQRYEICYFDHLLPIAPDQAADLERLSVDAFDTATTAGQGRLHALLEKQNFRLAWWRIANDAINWRRFFDINELAALRAEDEDVFEAVHALPFRLFREGLIDGVRIDHIDGLANPQVYCERLRARFDTLCSQRPAAAAIDRAYIVVEKILAASEQLPRRWNCDGSSGYDFMDQVSRLQHDPRGEEPLGWLWETLSGRPAAFEREEEASRREVLARSFAAQLDAAATALYRLALSHVSTRDAALPAIRRALSEILVHLRIYRTYMDDGADVEANERYIGRAVAAAAQTCLRQDRDLVRKLPTWLGEANSGGAPDLRRDAVRKFEQLSAPIAAKAVEDTAFYRHGKLLSRIDVGFDPKHFAGSVATFHSQCIERSLSFPHTMLATATHDHKRGEDVRARLAVLSEIPEEWAAALTGWLKDATPLQQIVEGSRAPSLGDAVMLLQMIAGAWPHDLTAEDHEGCRHFVDRLALWQQKALREAKLVTDWIVPNEAYETAARDFLRRLFESEQIAKIAAFAQRIAPAGAVNGLGQTLLKLTTPGVPDIYQGTEFWDFSLVDPDNRRPVDFDARQNALAAQEPMAALARNWRDGRIKQSLIRHVLAVRRAAADLFADGDYVVLDAVGPQADHVVAFARTNGKSAALIVACRLVARWLQDDALVIPPARWGDTRICLPEDLAAMSFRDVFSEQWACFEDGEAPVSRLLDSLPVAFWLNEQA